MADNDRKLFERCNSAPILQWELISSSPTKYESKPLTPTSDHLLTPDDKSKIFFKRTKLRRHSSLTKGLLQRCRTTSDADERLGEAKINTSISLTSSTEKLNIIPASLGNTSTSSNPTFFRPIGSPNSVFDSPRSASPDSRCEYPLRSRQQPGRQVFKPTGKRKRSACDSSDLDPGLPLRPLTSAKRLRLENEDIVSNDSGASDLNLPMTGGAFDVPLPPPPPTATDTLDWWLESNQGFSASDRIRRMSSESSLSIDSITREFNSTSSNSCYNTNTPKETPPSLPP